MNLILLFNSDFIKADSKVRLTGRRMQHVLSIHRAEKGDTLKVGLANNDIGKGTIASIAADYIEMDVIFDAKPPQPLPVTLLLALPRPKSLRKAIQCATAMGVKKFFFIRTWKVEKSYFQSPLLSQEHILEQFILGLEQGCDTIIPSFETRMLFKPFVEDEVPELIKNTQAIAGHPDSVSTCPCNINKPVTLALGPEGGFIQYEIDALKMQGFEPVSLGPRPLRVEDALAAILGRLY